jgi:phosphomannomutase
MKTEEKTVLFAFEEAIGYSFLGTFVRDKDAVTASVVAAEMGPGTL